MSFKEKKKYYFICKKQSFQLAVVMVRYQYLKNVGSLQEDLSRKILHNDVTEQFTCGPHQVGVAALQRTVQQAER